MRQKLDQMRTLAGEIQDRTDSLRALADEMEALLDSSSSAAPSIVVPPAGGSALSAQDETKAISRKHEKFVPFVYPGPKDQPLVAYGHHCGHRSKDARVQEIVDRVFTHRTGPLLLDSGKSLGEFFPSRPWYGDANPSVVSLEEAEYILDVDLRDAREEARRIICWERSTTGNVVSAHWDRLPEAAQEIVVRMVFQMGGGSVGTFKNFRNALRRKDYLAAAREMVTGSSPGTPSKWLSDTEERCREEEARMKALVA